MCFHKHLWSICQYKRSMCFHKHLWSICQYNRGLCFHKHLWSICQYNRGLCFHKLLWSICQYNKGLCFHKHLWSIWQYNRGLCFHKLLLSIRQYNRGLCFHKLLLSICQYKRSLFFHFKNELSHCHTLWFSNPFIIVTQCHRPEIFQTINSLRLNNLNLKYKRFTPTCLWPNPLVFFSCFLKDYSSLVQLLIVVLFVSIFYCKV